MPWGASVSTYPTETPSGSCAAAWYVYGWPAVADVSGGASKTGDWFGAGVAIAPVRKARRRPDGLRNVTVMVLVDCPGASCPLAKASERSSHQTSSRAAPIAASGEESAGFRPSKVST